MTNKKVIVIVSGGMDSATLLYKVITDGLEPYAVSFNYGQRHVKELDYAKRFCSSLGIDHKVVDLSAILPLIQGSSLTSSDIEVPHGHYAADNMKSTVVPNRNMIMLSIAVGYAVSIGAGTVYFGAQSGDNSQYRDCRPEFLDRMDRVTSIANEVLVHIEAPFIHMSKTDTVKLGLKLGIKYAGAWSCYEGKERPCLRCGACSERAVAFRDNQVADPLLTPEEWKEALQIVEGVV